ncbi:universal stress protein [Halomarina salina]|uniref:Universal stress protein n=1 Tax=Halomarina salina TaxID=1872699 RepID=A0ABD5RN37_9EURY|nr:universal stress protein [Halomarina salina]
MTSSVLVPMTYGPLSEQALRHALETYPDSEVTALHVVDFRSSDRGPGGWGDEPSEWDDWLDTARAHADELFADARDVAAEYDRELRTESTVGKAAPTIVEYAEEHDPDVVVMGSHDRSAPARFLLGSVADHVVRRSPVPVLLVR